MKLTGSDIDRGVAAIMVIIITIFYVTEWFKFDAENTECTKAGGVYAKVWPGYYECLKLKASK